MTKLLCVLFVLVKKKNNNDKGDTFFTLFNFCAVLFLKLLKLSILINIKIYTVLYNLNFTQKKGKQKVAICI